MRRAVGEVPVSVVREADEVFDGPATAPQPRFVTRTDGDGNLQVRPPGTG
ncbi:hypothetical protein [Kitasatospora sp. NPDC057015]